MAVIKPENLFKYLDKRLKDGEKKSLKRWQSKAKPAIKKEIKNLVAQGKSPVSKEGDFEKYSESYKKQIRGKLGKKYGKNTKPVNLKLSGKMMKSLSVRNIKAGMSVFLSNKIAKYHNGHGRVDRFIIPSKAGQEFRRDIKIKLAGLYKKVFKI